MMVVDGDVLRWEPEEQFQWSQWYERNEKMDLKRAISRVETIMRRPSWQDTDQRVALAVLVEAAKKQLPPEPRDHLHLYFRDGQWQINKWDARGGQLQTRETWEAGALRHNPHIIVKVPV